MKRDDDIIEALRTMEGVQAGSERPSPELVMAMAKQALTRSLQPVRPLPSDGVLIVLVLGCFVVFCLLVASLFGMYGYHHLSVYQKLAYYAAIVLSAITVSAALVLELIPGSLRTVQPGLLLLIPTAGTALVTIALFPRGDFYQFAHIGYPCLRMGTICAVLAGALWYGLLRNGFSSAPMRTAAAGGVLAGLAGFGVLALHCPILNYAHILVWHGGAIALALIGGVGLARWRQSSLAGRA
jgi:hypothetical protein